MPTQTIKTSHHKQCQLVDDQLMDLFTNPQPSPLAPSSNSSPTIFFGYAVHNQPALTGSLADNEATEKEISSLPRGPATLIWSTRSPKDQFWLAATHTEEPLPWTDRAPASPCPPKFTLFLLLGAAPCTSRNRSYICTKPYWRTQLPSSSILKRAPFTNSMDIGKSPCWHHNMKIHSHMATMGEKVNSSNLLPLQSL